MFEETRDTGGGFRVAKADRLLWLYLQMVLKETHDEAAFATDTLANSDYGCMNGLHPSLEAQACHHMNSILQLIKKFLFARALLWTI